MIANSDSPIIAKTDKILAGNDGMSKDFGFVYAIGNAPPIMEHPDMVRLLPPISLTTESGDSSMAKASLIDYGTQHCLRFDIKARNVGKVTTNCLERLVRNWETVWRRSIQKSFYEMAVAEESILARERSRETIFEPEKRRDGILHSRRATMGQGRMEPSATGQLRKKVAETVGNESPAEGSNVPASSSLIDRLAAMMESMETEDQARIWVVVIIEMSKTDLAGTPKRRTEMEDAAWRLSELVNMTKACRAKTPERCQGLDDKALPLIERLESSEGNHSTPLERLAKSMDNVRLLQDHSDVSKASDLGTPMTETALSRSTTSACLDDILTRRMQTRDINADSADRNSALVWLSRRVMTDSQGDHRTVMKLPLTVRKVERLNEHANGKDETDTDARVAESAAEETMDDRTSGSMDLQAIDPDATLKEIMKMNQTDQTAILMEMDKPDRFPHLKKLLEIVIPERTRNWWSGTAVAGQQEESPLHEEEWTDILTSAGKTRQGGLDSSSAQDVEYELIKNPRAFFKKGRYFKTPWPEPRGFSRPDSAASSTESVIFFEPARFVVVKTKPTHCICLRINTYSGRATTKSGVVVADHAAVLPVIDGKASAAPTLHPNGEAGLRPPIFIKLEDQDVTIDPMSRLNVAKPYTIEYNIRVRKLGRVWGDSVARVEDYFLDSLGLKAPASGSGRASAEPSKGVAS